MTASHLPQRDAAIWLWLDDTRPAPTGWTWVKTPEDAIEYLKAGLVERASLDHDLGFPEDRYEACIAGRITEQEAEATGYEVVCWMEEHRVWPEGGVQVHSMNPVGAQRMRKVIARAYGEDVA